jgi:WD40 repeat protein
MSLNLKFVPHFFLSLCFASVSVMAQRPELIVQTGHADNVNSVAFSPDGRLLASASIDGVIKIWDAATGFEVRMFAGHSSSLNSIVFSPDGKLLAAGTGDFTVILWEVATGAMLRTLKGHVRVVNSVAFSPDGRTIVSGSGGIYYGKGENTIKLWEVNTGALLRTLPGHAEEVYSVAFSPDGKIIASGSGDKKIKLWDAVTGKRLRTLEGHSKAISSVAFIPDGKGLVSGSHDATIKLWDLTTGRQLQTLTGHSGQIETIALSPDGKLLTSGGEDRAIRLWEMTTGKALQTLAGHPRTVFAVAFSPDGKMVLSGGSEHMLKLWDVTAGRELRTLRRRAVMSGQIAISPDGKTLAGGGIGPTVKLWDLFTGQEPNTLKGAAIPLPQHLAQVNLMDEVSCIAYSPDGKILASGNMNDTIELWDTVTGQALRILKGHTHMVNTLDFSPDGKLLASASNDATIRLWDPNNGQELFKLTGHVSAVWSVAFSTDGKRLASASHDGTLRLWDVLTGQQVSLIKGPSDQVYYEVSFSPDGKLLASASQGSTIRLWDASTGRQLRQLEGDYMFFAFSPDSRMMASGDTDYTINLRDVATGQVLHTLKGHTSRLRSAAFSPDGKWLASGSIDATIKLWEVETGKELVSLIALDQQDWLVITPDGLFDGSSAAWSQILWRFSQGLNDVAPVEIFFNEFYHPGLLADVLTGGRPRATQDISQKDRRQPQVALELAEGQTATGGNLNSRNVTVRIKVSESPADSAHRSGSGAQDLRLFRNGSLVKVWRGDLLSGQDIAGCKAGAQGGMVCEASIPIIAGDNRLLAYAFNQDNIKSADASLSLTGDERLKRKGVAYILAIGINSYANAQYNLKYAVADAQAFSEEIKRQQEKIGRYERIEIISLYDKDAVKSNIIERLKQLAAKVQPEDAVLVYFAGHGAAAKQRFYLIPHDLGYEGARREVDRAGIEKILAHSISDRELERAFEGLDAGQILFVIDACNSGQALEAEEKRRGPMNSKGLAQLAYEKGISILTAAQSYQAALEAARLGHGYLTYALIEEGLKQGAADAAPQDKQIALREWLNYATQRVPEMQEEKMQAVQTGQARILEQEEVAFVEGEQSIRDPKQRSIQRPRAFFRREPETQPFIIARP